MERLADCDLKNDDSRDVGPVQNPCWDGKQYPINAAQQSTDGTGENNQESGPSTRRFAGPLKEGESSQESLGSIDDATETDWEDGNSHDFEGVNGTSASPPPKRKRLSQVVLHGFRAPGAVDYALVDRDHAAPQACGYQDTVGGSTEAMRERRQIPIEEPQTMLVARPEACGRKRTVLHNFVMVLTFLAIVSLWGIVDMVVEVASGVNSESEFQLYAVLLLVGVVATLTLRKLKALAYRGTFYPTLFSSLLTAAAGWGLVDVSIEVAAGGDKAMRLLYYFIVFLGTGFLVALHMLLVDRGFSEVLERFI